MSARSDDPATRFIAAVRPEQGVLLEQLRAIVVKNVPGATVTTKWGVPFYELGGKKICALAAFKEHVGINIFAPRHCSSIQRASSKAKARAIAC